MLTLLSCSQDFCVAILLLVKLVISFGSGLGLIYRNTKSIEILSHIQKLYKTKYVTISQLSNAQTEIHMEKKNSFTLAGCQLPHQPKLY